MSRLSEVEHRFVDTAPEPLDEGIVYVSVRYATVLHLCGCGCRSEIVTPISRQGWSLIFDGVTVSLHPSIGNWNYPCRSHYWIRHNRIEWARNGISGRQDRSERSTDTKASTTSDCPDKTVTAIVGVWRLVVAALGWVRRHLRVRKNF